MTWKPPVVAMFGLGLVLLSVVKCDGGQEGETIEGVCLDACTIQRDCGEVSDVSQCTNACIATGVTATTRCIIDAANCTAVDYCLNGGSCTCDTTFACDAGCACDPDCGSTCTEGEKECTDDSTLRYCEQGAWTSLNCFSDACVPEYPETSGASCSWDDMDQDYYCFCYLCGDGVCSPDYGENASNCSTDCSGGSYCGDGTCDAAEDATNCSADCGSSSYCGDGTCDAGEDSSSCPADCGSTQCAPMGDDCSSLECCMPSSGIAVCQNGDCCGGPNVSCAGTDWQICCAGTMYCNYGTDTCQTCNPVGTVLPACDNSCCSGVCSEDANGVFSCSTF